MTGTYTQTFSAYEKWTDSQTDKCFMTHLALVLSYAYTPVLASVPKTEDVCMPLVGGGTLLLDDVPFVECMHLVFTHIPGDSYRRQFGSLLLYPLLE